MRNYDELGAQARAYFHRQTGYCASHGARAKAAYLARQEEKNAVEAAQRTNVPKRLIRRKLNK